ncbi:RNB domain-containing ribonuclease [Sphaerisporangium album]|uniref:RNB domain-containing ribonuclease n=1 Tax=Sphaerisporangium album TaxID=509200 RepID=A0A367FNU9_9ACTN|nr:RNB domain-containing ribonuclease [Sphaerisporangium album]RCG31914.1 RNB domain-containing ribonuclease [Sphaerisporangium album]
MTTPLMIDREGTLDRDDAIHVQPDSHGGWYLTVHIANVAAALQDGSTYDTQARHRGHTVYGPTWTRSMLPKELEQQLTLHEHRPNATLAITLTIRADGTVEDTWITRDTLRAPVAMSYDLVPAALADYAHPHHTTLSLAAHLATTLLSKRRADGALAVYDLIRGWATNDDGQLIRVDAPERNIGYIIVQEAMIAANAALAAWAIERDVPILFRNHTAAAATPPVRDLAADLDHVIASGVTSAFEATQRRLALVMRPALYESTVRGHYALTLPAYSHATSPLRRYADLVTQRQIIAALDGRTPPYTTGDLDQIADELNTAARERRERRSQALKDRAHTAARTKAATADDLADLTPAQFAPVLKRACKEGAYSDDLAAEVIRRSHADELALLDQHMVLSVATDPRWAPARRVLLDHVAADPQDAVSLLNMRSQQHRCTPVSFTTTVQEGPPPLFTAFATMQLDNGSAWGAGRRAPVKKLAQQLAATSLLAALAGVDDPTGDIIPSESTPAEDPFLSPGLPPAPPPGQHPVSSLTEYTHKGYASDTQWDVKRTGPDHAPKFTAWVTATIRGRGELTASGQAGSKAGARERAAAALLEQIHAAPLPQVEVSDVA